MMSITLQINAAMYSMSSSSPMMLPLLRGKLVSHKKKKLAKNLCLLPQTWICCCIDTFMCSTVWTWTYGTHFRFRTRVV